MRPKKSGSYLVPQLRVPQHSSRDPRVQRRRLQRMYGSRRRANGLLDETQELGALPVAGQARSRCLADAAI